MSGVFHNQSPQYFCYFYFHVCSLCIYGHMCVRVLTTTLDSSTLFIKAEPANQSHSLLTNPQLVSVASPLWGSPVYASQG